MEHASYFLAVKWVYAGLVAVWIASLLRGRRPGLIVAGAILLSLFTLLAIEIPLQRLYAFAPPLDRAFHLAVSSTAATGHSVFESYQVGAAAQEPFWRLTSRLASFGNPENTPHLYRFLPGLVLVLVPVSWYFGLGGFRRAAPDDRRWEAALVASAVVLLSSSAVEHFGVFRAFWPMNFHLKPNHVLALVLLPWWIRAFSSARSGWHAVAAGLLLGLLGWVFLMHWAYVLLGLLAYPLVAYWARRPMELGKVSVVAAVSAAVTLPYVAFLASEFHWGHGGALAAKFWRRFGYAEGFHNVFSFGYEHGVLFLLSLVGVVGMARRRRRVDLVVLALLSGIALGWLGHLVLLGLQRIVEPEEFYYYSRFVLTVSAASGAFFGLEAVRIWLGSGSRFHSRTAAVSLFLVVMTPQTFTYWWNPASMDRYFQLALEPVPAEPRRLGRWIRENTVPHAVFMADADMSIWIAALSGRRVFLTGAHRPPADFEERVDLEERLLRRPTESAYQEAAERFRLSHLAVSSTYLERFGSDVERLETLPWLEKVYRGDEITVYALSLPSPVGEYE